MRNVLDDQKAEEGHGRRAARSGAASMAIRMGNAAFQFASVLVLARFLTPEDYGLVVMVLALTGFATLFVDLGSRDAIARRERVTAGEVSALFWITIVMGCGLALLTALSAPLIARLYGEPRLTNITLVSSLVFVTTALSCQHQALMRRAMQFQRLASIEVMAGVLSGLLAIALAWAGWAYWALVIRPVAMSVLTVAGVWANCHWVPQTPTLTRDAREMIRFGVRLIGHSMTEYVRGNVDRVAIGWRHGAIGLGQYQNATQVYTNILDPLNYLQEVAVGSLSKLLHDLREFRRLWAKALSSVTFFAMPAFGLLAVTSQDVIVILLGSQWAGSGVILGVLALRGMPQILERTVGWLHISAGRADRLVRWSLLAAAVQTTALIVSLPFGIMAVTATLVLTSYLLCLPALAYAGHPLGIRVLDVVAVVGRQFLGSLVAVGVGFLLRETVFATSSGVERTALLSVTYLACYLGIVAGLFRMTEPLSLAWALLRNLRSGPPASADGPRALRVRRSGAAGIEQPIR